MSGGSRALALPTLTPPPTGILSPVGGGVNHGRILYCFEQHFLHHSTRSMGGCAKCLFHLNWLESGLQAARITLCASIW